ncbi:MAG: hypothetical protein WGN25_03670 [Candidatus Electrothrix sp. GW3-4]|uniref:hypothetical protein n=1 Tax=Candidatus Electrothrix sp. GW3-4 TaxID=3126740 RepID=UPI0030CE644B
MKKKNKSKIFTEEMTATIRKAVNSALLHHKAVGNKIAYWSEGQIQVEVPRETQLHIVKTSPLHLDRIK